MSDERQAPDWIRPGAEVVCIYGRENLPSPVLTIDRVLKRDVVLTNGDRWSLTRVVPNGSHISKPGTSTWDPSSALFPAEHPRVAAARLKQSELEGRRRIESLTHHLHESVRHQKWDAAYGQAENLLRHLDARRTPPSSDLGDTQP